MTWGVVVQVGHPRHYVSARARSSHLVGPDPRGQSNRQLLRQSSVCVRAASAVSSFSIVHHVLFVSDGVGSGPAMETPSHVPAHCICGVHHAGKSSARIPRCFVTC